MIFKQWKEILEGKKTQTRRVVKPGEVDDKTLCYDSYEWPDLRGRVRLPDKISAIYTGVSQGNLRLKWQVGRTYAIQPGRGQKQVGRIRLTAIRQERVQDISEADVIAEGVELRSWGYDWTKTAGYAELWDVINTRKPMRWIDNPLVWVLTFELDKSAEADS
jgi:hypothetical protein